jgi:preprotein translocase SecE subunit
MAETSIKDRRERRRKRRQDTPKEIVAENTKAAEQPTGNIVVRTFTGTRHYVTGVVSEIRKVTWPSREETARLTRIVTAVTVASALALGGLSLVFTEMFSIGVDQPWVFLVVFVVFLVLLFAYSRFSGNESSTEY